MKINIWIRKSRLDDLNHFLSENFRWDKEMNIDIWYEKPSSVTGVDINEYLSVSISYDQYKKLEDL